MKFHCLLHADFEQPGHFITWAHQRNFSVDITHVYKNEKLPELDSFDTLLIMGGPQSTHETDKYPYLVDEIELIKRAIHANKYVIGVCLGAQLLSASYGASAEQSPHKEIGVFPVTLTTAGRSDPLFTDFPDQFDSGHWHAEMPGLPDTATVIASSQGCPRQIIRFSKMVYGFQCHMEFDQASIQALIQNSESDFQEGMYIQDARCLLKQDYSNMNHYLGQFLDKLLFSS